MAVYLSPGVFPREIDLSVLPSAVGPMRAAFVGTAKRGPLNTPILVTSAQQAIDTFGEPFPDSHLMYAVLAFFEEGNQCYVMRVGVECESGQADALADICIDNSGARGSGWGRIPLFAGIDYGRINLRNIDSDNPITFHAASTGSVTYNDVVVSTTNGATDATLSVTGTYTGSVDDAYVMVITGAPTTSSGASVDGATYEIVRNSTGEVIDSGSLDDSDLNGTSQVISIGDGLSIQVVVSDGVLDENDTFTFSVVADNRKFSVSVEGDTPTEHTMPSATYTTVAAFVAAANALTTSDDYVFVEYTLSDGVSTIPQIRSSTAGERIQVTGTIAWANNVGTSQYAYDIPRSFLIGVDSGPYNITTQNNRVKMNVIGDTSTTTVEFNVATGLDQTADAIAGVIDVAGVVAGDTLFESFALTVPGGTSHVVIVASPDHELDTLAMMASYSNLKTLRFAGELNIAAPYQRSYRGFSDNRLTLPAAGESDAAVPLSCETDPLSSDCASDTAYFANIVGWLVAPTPGTWVDDYSASLSVYVDSSATSGRYRLTLKDPSGVTIDLIDNISFDKRDTRYIGNVINPGSKFGGQNGNPIVNWEERPAYLANDINDTDTFAVRYPSQFNNVAFAGQADGIPSDAAYSNELDSAIIGNPAVSSGLYAFQNPEAIDINLLATPGFSTGAVIGNALQICQSRGDVLYLVDPPFGLRPQQVVDWHNGMLLSDLQAAVNSSYGSLYWGWIKVYDQFSSQEVWVPPSGHVSAVFARTARNGEQWDAPAGLRRGHLLTALDIEYSPSIGERDLLYGNGNAVNPITKFPQDGIVIWGQRTLQRTDSELNRCNVRMLMTDVKKNATRILRPFTFEPNDRILWKQASAALEPYFSDVQQRRGLRAYKVIIDETNNTPDRIDNHELWVSIFLMPVNTVEFIVLNLALLPSGASFATEEVLAAAGVVSAATAT